MKLLLDTHVFIWLTTRGRLPSPRAQAAVEDFANVLHLSAVSHYEIEYKRGRDPELQRMPPDLTLAATRQGVLGLDITSEHAAVAARLPVLHRDPWDRLLVAQSIVDGMALVSADRRIKQYDVDLVW